MKPDEKIRKIWDEFIIGNKELEPHGNLWFENFTNFKNHFSFNNNFFFHGTIKTCLMD